MNKMDNLFKELAEAIMVQKQIEKQIDGMKSDIRAYMEKNNLHEIMGSEHKAKLIEVNQTKLDRKKLEEDHPRIAKRYTVDSSYMRLNFT